MSQTLPRPKASFRRRFVRTLAVGVGLYVLTCIGYATFQRRLIYHPPSCTVESIERRAQADGLERWQAPGGKDIGWKRLSPRQPAQGCVLVMHGNAGCAFQCGHYADVIQGAAPFDVFIVEYPGYGNRPGAPSEHSLYEAADEAFRLLPTNTPAYLVGESLGSGVAAYLAGRYPDKVGGVVQLSPYNRLADVAQAHMPLLPARWLLTDRFPSEDYLRNYHGPVAVLISSKDKVVPEKFGRRLYDGYAGPKRLWEFPQGTHGTAMFQPVGTWKEIIGFWQTEGGGSGGGPRR
jgi:pimeloyl-ACP methyl ester carboxylesterase